MSKGVRIYYEKKQDYTHHGEELYSMNITFDTALLRNTAEKNGSKNACSVPTVGVFASKNPRSCTHRGILLQLVHFNSY